MKTDKSPACLARFFFKLILLFLLFSTFATSLALADNRTVKVGLYEAKPSVFTDASVKTAGLYVDILDRIVKSEGWQLHYLPGTCSESLDCLEKGETDLVSGIVKTPEPLNR